ncbi:MAG: DNA replication/repair protein RecF [Eubacteriales bacterium]|nr:DNA replication/repair protein RecF [Eubacteriales bacterium]
MHVTKIELINYRNYRDLQITVQPDMNVFFGANAQGKTNILEAVYLCACARSHRTSKDSDLIYQGQDHYGIKLQFATNSGQEEEIEIRYYDLVNGDPQRTKAVRQIYQNGVKLDKVSDLMGLFHAVIFAPEDLMLIKEGPSSRRRYLDLLISQVKPTYFQDLQRYSRMMLQRNKMLKDLRDGQKTIILHDAENNTESSQIITGKDQLDVWDLQLSDYAARIIATRLYYTERITELAEKSHYNISSGKEKLKVRYRSISGISPKDGIKELSEKIYQKYKTNVYDDIQKGLTSVGPHRDDLELLLNDEPMKPYASQGQQRSAVLSLKLAELEIITQDIGERPVLLLDDVMSELDADRRRCLLESIDEAQVFVTCTEANHVVSEIRETKEKNRQFMFFDVYKGSATQVEQPLS